MFVDPKPAHTRMNPAKTTTNPGVDPDGSDLVLAFLAGVAFPDHPPSRCPFGRPACVEAFLRGRDWAASPSSCGDNLPPPEPA